MTTIAERPFALTATDAICDAVRWAVDELAKPASAHPRVTLDAVRVTGIEELHGRARQEHETVLLDDVFAGHDDGDAHAEMAARIREHELALQDPEAGASLGVYVGLIDEPFGYADPAVQAAVHATTQQQAAWYRNAMDQA